MHLQHFGTDPTDIRIRINPKIRIRIPITFGWNFGVGGGLRWLAVVVVGASRGTVNRWSKTARLGSTTRKPVFDCTARISRHVVETDHPLCRPLLHHLPAPGLFSDPQWTTRVRSSSARAPRLSQISRYTSRSLTKALNSYQKSTQKQGPFSVLGTCPNFFRFDDEKLTFIPVFQYW